MKKIISLLASIPMLASAFTAVSAASIETNAPVASTVVEEIDADTLGEFTDGDAELEDGQKAYLITVDFTGLDLVNGPGGDTNGDDKVSTSEKKARTGVLLSAAEYGITWDSEENIVAIYDEIRDIVDNPGFLDQTEEVYGLKNISALTDMLPSASTSATVEATELRASSYVVVTDGTPVTGKVTTAALVLREKLNGARVNMENYDIDKGNIGIEVNGEKTTVVTLGAAAGGDEGDDGDEGEEVTEIKPTKYNLLANGGYAWDVVIENYDSEKTYATIFTDGEETRTVGDNVLTFPAETEGDIAFAILMKTARQNVELKIAIQ